jgi:hypothetical protein
VKKRVALMGVSYLPINPSNLRIPILVRLHNQCLDPRERVLRHRYPQPFQAYFNTIGRSHLFLPPVLLLRVGEMTPAIHHDARFARLVGQL